MGRFIRERLVREDVIIDGVKVDKDRLTALVLLAVEVEGVSPDAARTSGRELLIEIIAGKDGPIDESTVARVIQRLHDLKIRPDWWKLEPNEDPAAWRGIEETILRNDIYCRGILLLGLDAPAPQLRQSFRAAKSSKLVKGFAIGRTIFGEAATRWFAGSMTDEEAVADMAHRFQSLTRAWEEAVQHEAA